MRVMMWVLLVAVIAGCGSTQKSDTIRIALNWFPESEHGGFFAAVVPLPCRTICRPNSASPSRPLA